MSESLWKDIYPYITFWTDAELPVSSVNRDAGVSFDEHDHASSTVARSSTAFEQHMVGRPEDDPSPSINEERRSEPKTENDELHSFRVHTLPREGLDDVKKRYIVGKKCGKDLLRKDGSLLCSKGDVITDKNVEEAEMEGKLIELIVNMDLTRVNEQ